MPFVCEDGAYLYSFYFITICTHYGITVPFLYYRLNNPSFFCHFCFVLVC